VPDPVHALLTQPGFERDPAIAYVKTRYNLAASAMLFVLRILGVWFLLLAMVAAVVDGTKSLAGGGQLVVTPLGDQWLALSPTSLQAAKAAIVTNVAPALWDPVIATILQAPTWLVFGLIGGALYWLGRKRRPVEIFIN
jgi:hypothetical protein